MHAAIDTVPDCFCSGWKEATGVAEHIMHLGPVL